MAAQWMFSRESDLQARCLSLKEETAVSERHTETPHKVCFCKLWSGDLGQGTSLLNALVFSSRISHSTVVRKNEMLHTKPLGRGAGIHPQKSLKLLLLFYYYQPRQSMPKLKARSSQTGKGIPLAPTTIKKGDICKSRVFKVGVICDAGWRLCLVWFKSNQQIHFPENVLIKLLICVESWRGSLHT